MPWITLPNDDAHPITQRMAESYAKQGRSMPGILAVMKPNPQALRSVNQMNRAVTFGGSSLGRRWEELIAATTSVLGQCFY